MSLCTVTSVSNFARVKSSNNILNGAIKTLPNRNTEREIKQYQEYCPNKNNTNIAAKSQNFILNFSFINWEKNDKLSLPRQFFVFILFSG